MKHTRRIQALEDRAAQRQARRDEAEDATVRLIARLDAIGQRLRAHGVVPSAVGTGIEMDAMDADELAERFALVRAEIQRSREPYDAWRF
jgi:hypothetical protein